MKINKLIINNININCSFESKLLSESSISECASLLSYGRIEARIERGSIDWQTVSCSGDN